MKIGQFPIQMVFTKWELLFIERKNRVGLIRYFQMKIIHGDILTYQISPDMKSWNKSLEDFILEDNKLGNHYLKFCRR